MQQGLTTQDFAKVANVKADSIRAGLCRQGHYMGIRPVKLPNRLLLWPADAVERLLSGQPLEVAK